MRRATPAGNSDFVLCICTEEYKRRVEGKVSADVGKGVFWEGTLIYTYVYNEKGNQRCIPVLLGELRIMAVPSILNGYSRFHLQKFTLDDPQSDYSKLYRLLTWQHDVEKADLGEILKLPPLPPAERHTDFTQLIQQILAEIVEVRGDTEKILSILQSRTLPVSTPGRSHNLPPWMAPQYFIGRSQEVRALLDGMTAQDAEPSAVIQPHVLVGGGGVGKTRLGIQTVWILYLQSKYERAFYVSASSPSELDVQLAALSESSLLNIYEGREPPHDLGARRYDVIHVLREEAGCWVLLIDAVDSEAARDATISLLKELAGGRFIITSRRDDWPKGIVCKIPVDVFTAEEARACLHSRYWKAVPSAQELDDFDRIAKELGRLPLALALAASYMGSRRISAARYLEIWKEKHDLLLKFSAPDVDYNRSLLAAFQLSYDQLDSRAATLLGLLAWLSPDPFPRRLVEGSEQIQKFLLETGKTAGIPDVTEALAQLRTLSLIELDEEMLQVHKLVRDCARAILSNQQRRETFASALRWLTTSLPKPEFSEVDWQLWKGLAPHLDAAVQAAKQLRFEDRIFALLCNDYALWLYNQAQHQTAEPLMRWALAIDKESLGLEHPKVARDLNDLGQLLHDTNRMAEAEPMMRQALAIDEKSFGREHPKVARDLSDLARLLHDTNRMAEAEPMMRRALAIDDKMLGPEHVSLAICLNNLAEMLRATNRMAEAEPMMRRALAIDDKNLGPQHPNVAIRLNNLARLLQDTNRMTEAEPMMRRALAIDERNFGPQHPNVAVGLNNLAVLLQQINRVAEAEPLLRRALQIDEKSLGLEHPAVANRLHNLAALLHDTNRLDEAETLMRRALTIVEKSFGPDHPSVANCLTGLAQILHDTNHSMEAESLMRRALEIDEKSFGLDHPNTARDLGNLAALLQDSGGSKEAEPMMRSALAIDEKSFGPDHPTLAIRLNNLALFLQKTGKPDEAESLMRRALSIDERSFGSDHPSVARDLNNLGSLLQSINRLTEAESLMFRALMVFLRCSHDSSHPHSYLSTCFRSYLILLKEKMSLTDGQIHERLAKLSKETRIPWDSYRSMLQNIFT